jgi:hypothetical protein
MKRLFAVLLASGAMAGAAAPSVAHQSGCHAEHSCPSDHHTYLWASGGTYWDCAGTSAPEYDPTLDTTAFAFDGQYWGCHPAGTAPPSSAPTPTPTPTPAPSPGPVTGELCVAGVKADRDCTPGAFFATATRAKLCKAGYTKKVRHVTAATKRNVFEEYAIEYPPPADTYEVDHLIALEIGGSNAIENLWPEAYAGRRGARTKDKQENALHRRVCAGTLSLKAAQRRMVRDWSR